MPQKRLYKSINMGQGIFPDLPPHDTKIEILTDCANVRFMNNSAYRVGAFSIYQSTTGVPNHIFHADFYGQNYILYSTPTKLNCIYSNTDYTLRTFSITSPEITSIFFNDLYLYNSPDIQPLYWNFNLSATAQPLPYLGSSVRFKALRNFKSVLIGLNVKESGTSYPNLVWWSHPADPGSLPSWDYMDTTKIAGRIDLIDDTGVIVDGKVLGNVFYIYKENSIYAMNYIGGMYVFGFTKVCDTQGIANVNCIETVKDNHVVFGKKDIYIFDGRNITSLVEGKIKNFIFNNISQEDYSKCYVLKNKYFSELLFCFPHAGATYCNKALAWNYKYNTFQIIDLPDTTFGNASAVGYSSLQWDNIAEMWDDAGYRWNYQDDIPFNQRVMFTTKDGIMLMDTMSTLANAKIYSSYIEKKGVSIYDDSNPNFAERYKLLRYIRPKIYAKNNTKFNIWVGTHSNIHEEPRYVRKGEFVVGKDFNFDCLVSGRYFAIKILSGDNSTWRIDNIDMEFLLEGEW